MPSCHKRFALHTATWRGPHLPQLRFPLLVARISIDYGMHNTHLLFPIRPCLSPYLQRGSLLVSHISPISLSHQLASVSCAYASPTVIHISFHPLCSISTTHLTASLSRHRAIFTLHSSPTRLRPIQFPLLSKNSHSRNSKVPLFIALVGGGAVFRNSSVSTAYPRLRKQVSKRLLLLLLPRRLKRFSLHHLSLRHEDWEVYVKGGLPPCTHRPR